MNEDIDSRQSQAELERDAKTSETVESASEMEHSGEQSGGQLEGQLEGQLKTEHSDQKQNSNERLTLENLPQAVKDKLPEDAQHIFIAAYNSILENSQDEDAAAHVAWQTIEHSERYARGEDSKWHRLPEDTPSHSQ